MHNKRIFILLSFLFFVSVVKVAAIDYSSTNYRVSEPVIFPGGYGTSDHFSLTGVVSQMTTGSSTSATKNLFSGFLYFPFVSTPIVSATPGDTTVSLFWTSAAAGVGWSVSGYAVGQSTVSGGPYSYFQVGNNLSAIAGGLTNSTPYYFVIRVIDALGNYIATSTQVSAIPTGIGSGGGFFVGQTISSASPVLVITDLTKTSNLFVNSDVSSPEIDVSSFISDGIGTLPEINITSYNADNVTVAIPASTLVISDDSTWDGIIEAPTITTVTLPVTSGQTKTLSMAIEVGSTETKLVFNKAIKLVFPGQAAKRIGYIRTGINFTEITNVCSANNQAVGNALAVSSECKIDVGSDLVVWTKHFTSFATYSQTINNTGSGSSGSGGGGGGSGGGSSYTPPSSGTGSVNLSGRAYPNSVITILKDAQIVATVQADALASFQVSVGNLSAGNYSFSVYGKDSQGRQSSLLTFPVYVTSGVAVNITGVFITPTIGVDRTQVKKGDNIAIFGQTANQSSVTIQVNSNEPYFVQTKADSVGAYLYNFDTSVLEMGDHSTKSKSATEGEISSYSKAVAFAVGTTNVFATVTKKTIKGDVNGDGKVNLTDYSVVAYWYKRANPPSKVDFNGDKQVNLVDFSILAFNWTG